MKRRMPVQIVSEEMYDKIFGRSKKSDVEVVADANRQETKKDSSERVTWMTAEEFFGDLDGNDGTPTSERSSVAKNDAPVKDVAVEDDEPLIPAREFFASFADEKEQN